MLGFIVLIIIVVVLNVLHGRKFITLTLLIVYVDVLKHGRPFCGFIFDDLYVTCISSLYMTLDV